MEQSAQIGLQHFTISELVSAAIAVLALQES